MGTDWTTDWIVFCSNKSQMKILNIKKYTFILLFII